MNEEGDKPELPKTVPRPAAPADYLKARPRVYLNRSSRRPPSNLTEKLPSQEDDSALSDSRIEQPDLEPVQVSQVSKRAQKKADKAAKKAERIRTEQLLRSDTMLGEPDITSHPEIENIWKEQEAIRLADEKLEQEYKAAKQRSKQLKQRIKKHNLEGDNLNLKGVLGLDSYEKVISTSREAKKILKKTAVTLKPVVKKMAVTAAKPVKKRKGLQVYLQTKRKTITLTALGIGFVVIGGVLLQKRLAPDKPKTADISSGTVVGGAVDEKPLFAILYPSDKDTITLRTVKVSPSGSAPSYAFIDTLEGVQVNITQQELPPAFKTNSSTELQKVAKDFQATDVIQVDETTVYHGLNQKSGVQSLILMKNGLLVLIRAEKKLSDDKWAGYIAALK